MSVAPLVTQRRLYIKQFVARNYDHGGVPLEAQRRFLFMGVLFLTLLHVSC